MPRLLWLPVCLALALVGCRSSGWSPARTWRTSPALVTSASALAALELSLRTAVASTVLCLLLGGPLAVVLARSHVPGIRLLRAVVLLPLVLPPVVGGLALLSEVDATELAPGDAVFLAVKAAEVAIHGVAGTMGAWPNRASGPT